jgi:hypothetical protein
MNRPGAARLQRRTSSGVLVRIPMMLRRSSTANVSFMTASSPVGDHIGSEHRGFVIASNQTSFHSRSGSHAGNCVIQGTHRPKDRLKELRR